MKTSTLTSIATALLLLSHNIVSAQTAVPKFQRVYSTAQSDKANAIAQTTTGDYLLAGSTEVVIDSPTLTTRQYMYVVKTDSAGNIKWSKTFGSVGNTAAAFSVEEGAYGYYVFGNTIDTATNVSVASLLHTDADGNVLWNKTYAMNTNEWGAVIKKINNNAYMLCGKSYTPLEDNEVFLLKVDSTGTVLWGRGYNGEPSLTDVAHSLTLTSDGGFLITGDSYFIPTHDYYALAIKTDSDGYTDWIKSYADSHNSRGLGGYEAGNGYIFGVQMVGATTAADMMLIRTDANGEVIWSKTYGGNSGDFAHAMLKQDSTYVLLGESSSFDSLGISHAWMVRTDTAGNLISSFTYGDTLMPTVALCAINTPHNGIAIAGTANAIGYGAEDFYFAKTVGDSTGCIEYAVTPTVDTITVTGLSTLNYDTLIAVVTDITGTIISGNIDSTSGLLDTTICSMVVIVPPDSIHVDTPVNIRQPLTAGSTKVYPNPSFGSFTIQTEKGENLLSVRFFNNLGTDVSAQFVSTISDNNINFKTKCLPGTYWVRTTNSSGKASVYKVLIE